MGRALRLGRRGHRFESCLPDRFQYGSIGFMNISIIDYPDVKCDEFVRQKPDVKLEHMPAWSDMIERTFGHKGFYLIARENGIICGVLPLTQVRSRLFGNRMISQAFSNYGGPLVNSRRALDALYNRAVELATEYKCQSIEFRNVEPLPYELYSRTDKIGMYVPLTSDPDDLWRSFKANIREQVRKAWKSGLVETTGGLELLDDFYKVYTIRMRELGTPGYPRKLFYNIFQTFPDCCRVFVVHLNELTVGAALTYCLNNSVEFPWASTLVKYNRLRPNYLLYWSIMKHYCREGAARLDFGRSTVGSTHHKFKNHWTPEPFQFHYQYWVQPGHKLSPVKPDNPRYRNKVKIWKKLPLWLTRIIGPYISRNLP